MNFLKYSALRLAILAVAFVLFEGKMRALFAILFGAGMALFINRAEAQDRDGDLLQARRLGWLHHRQGRSQSTHVEKEMD